MWRRFDFTAHGSPEQVFDVLTTQGLARWVPFLTHFTLDHKADEMRAGCTRTCHFVGLGALREEFVEFERGKRFSYRAESKILPIESHLAVVELSSIGIGRTRLTYSTYATWKRSPLTPVMKLMMGMMLKMATRKLSTLDFNSQPGA